MQMIKRTKELLWKAEVDLARTKCSDEMERLKGELDKLYDKEGKCGSKGHAFSGYRVGIRIQSSSMVLLLRGNDRIL